MDALVSCGTNLVCCNIREATKCGVRRNTTSGVRGSFQSRIIVESQDDEELVADVGEFPWMILVLKRDSSSILKKFCGGSLIRANSEFLILNYFSQCFNLNKKQFIS